MDSQSSIVVEPEFAYRVKGLSLRDGDTVIGLGDELTSDRFSWFEVLAAAHRIEHPGRKVRFVNFAAHGQTTAQMLEQMASVRALRPRIVLCMPGVHDARRPGWRRSPTVVSIRETDRNLFEMRSAVRNAGWLWIVPPGRRMAPIAFAADRYRWLDSDCEAVRSLIRAQDEPVVDPFGEIPGKRRSDRGEISFEAIHGRILKAVLERLGARH